ncbi:hypothetical protein [Mucilaginibacter phyllosphaerae]|uniref:Uncharacterized protein n=1 Tax=Mucilaginibacter phyllosphaerae TaxID=1812349 RepID=A0A4Y8A9C3_9SPHI|nr:hypothetical protein [Mucilaginibacter phyllosphaerae]MBB3969676.1 hypothetical protein [Mucilaginibacter phyllosphaerae]TEW65060.1 hypothetical protein E2R65_14180 [Mucilaginibacter phyllosphaerae]GGH18235.1 hypothetical protein GCM10007352_28810 [Mucilaginibacter phyllosphaerae]
MAEKFTINCLIKNTTCNLKVALKPLSNTESYHVYKDGRWFALLRRFDNNTYKAVSYPGPVCQLEVDAIGEQIDHTIANNKLKTVNHYS